VKKSTILDFILFVVVGIQILSFVVAVGGNRPRGRSADEAFSRWLANRTPQNEREFHEEMDRLEEGPRRIRRFGLMVFCANGVVLLLLIRERRAIFAHENLEGGRQRQTLK
jgi:hypothetical protein